MLRRAMTPTSAPTIELDPHDPSRAVLAGCWTLDTALQAVHRLSALPAGVRRLDARQVERLDSAGVLALLRHAHRAHMDGDALQFRDDHAALVASIEEVADARPPAARDYGIRAAVARLGLAVCTVAQDLVSLAGFLGESLVKLGRLALHPRRFRLTSTVAHMEQVGLDAVPLVVLLSYLIGAVIAFLGSTVLRDFGMEIYVVELVSIATLRELAVLLTAIVLAGRTASAFTAQIGSMQANEEIDAIRTLGLSPVELLVLPRVFAMLIALPILTFIAMLSGMLGGALVCALSLDISPTMYLSILQDSDLLQHFLVGLLKAPIFAFLIALIGCLEGFKVSGSAQSVGEHTTSAVVQSIFVVILLDALAALFLMEMGW